MIYIRIELWPLGDQSRKKLLAEGKIVNVDGSNEIADYEYHLDQVLHGTEIMRKFKSGKIVGFQRLRYGVWNLLARALREL